MHKGSNQTGSQGSQNEWAWCIWDRVVPKRKDNMWWRFNTSPFVFQAVGIDI